MVLKLKKPRRAFFFRAENGSRTRDLNLGKVTLYQLSYFRFCAPGQVPLLFQVGKCIKFLSFAQIPPFISLLSNSSALSLRGLHSTPNRSAPGKKNASPVYPAGASKESGFQASIHGDLSYRADIIGHNSYYQHLI